MIKVYFCYIIYQVLGRYLPDNDGLFSRFFFSERVRAWLVRGFTGCKSKNLYINKDAEISRFIQIGDNSGIGSKSVIGRGTVIGCNVMMGPEGIIYTRNHSFDRTDIPMREQGMQDFKPVSIGNDVWIGSRVTITPGVKVASSVLVQS